METKETHTEEKNWQDNIIDQIEQIEIMDIIPFSEYKDGNQ